ncbi:MAG TPA: MFS transporter [Reyranella sp.]|jgi:MFS family permease|nr:MFS transporter [Reyranella sp.]
MAEAATGGDAAGHRSIESRASWRAAFMTLAILSISFGSTLLIVVGMKPMQEALGTERAALALAGSLLWIGTGAGGILMGWLADRIGLRITVAIGACMIAGGLALSAAGPLWALYVGQGLMVGFLGSGGVYPPLLVYVSRWFDRRRGTAIALISSGQYVAGVVWPSVFERGISSLGWQATMLAYAGVVLVVILPLTLLLRPAPIPPAPPRQPALTAARRHRVAGLHPNVVQVLLCLAGFCCCIPMSVPQAHLVAFCSDIGISPARSAVMLSVMLASAFLARQAWGALADRIGGLRTILAGSAFQAVTIACFLLTQDEAGLFAVAAAFGMGFAGIIPAYSVAIRDLFPSSEASWRMPLTLFTAMSGMAFGSWFAGFLYDHFAYYAPAFGTGVLFNLINLGLIGFLVLRTGGLRRWPAWSAVA